MTQREKVEKIVEILDNKRAHNIVALDLMGATIISDFFIICTANSTPQMRALYDAVNEEMGKLGINATACEGMKNSDWALVDFDGVTVHIFSSQMRDFYGLDNLWADAIKLDIKTVDEQ